MVAILPTHHLLLRIGCVFQFRDCSDQGHNSERGQGLYKIKLHGPLLKMISEGLERWLIR